MSDLTVLTREGQIVSYDMNNHGLIVRIGVEVRQLLVIEASGSVAFRCVPSDPAWPTNLAIAGEWLKRNAVR